MTRPVFNWVVEPACELGFTEAQMLEKLGEQFPAFEEYMLMKAHPICKGPTMASPAGTCLVSHGRVFYEHDVAWFVKTATCHPRTEDGDC